MKASQSVYLDGDRKTAVAEGDPRARFLLVRAGGEVSEAVAEKYDGAAALLNGDAKPAPKDGPKPQNREADISPRTRDSKPAAKKAAK